jgi:hypothetical protein
MRSVGEATSEQREVVMSGAMLMKVSRKFGAAVCAARGHSYFYPGGAINTWCAYACVRCGELDCPLESLPCRPDDDGDFDRYNDEYEQQLEQDYERARRWFAPLPWPRWL